MNKHALDVRESFIRLLNYAIKAVKMYEDEQEAVLALIVKLAEGNKEWRNQQQKNHQEM